ncbi:VirB4 family type IV secretion system protein [Halomarina salina]|uniref:VirB4 family type IV secretion system protein n=1 Tax=Halomarina salina TaxID=1872699 RepID=A0ABD5RSN0_9EURY|nr:transferase [Halomarina salina]
MTALVYQRAVLERIWSALPPVGSPAGISLYGIGAVLVLITVANLLARRRSDDSPATVDLGEALDAMVEEDGHGSGSLGERHRTLVAPAAIEWETRAARVGEQWTTTLYIAGYPDYPSDGFLSSLFEESSLEFDCSVHLVPKQQRRAETELRNTAERLRADADIERTIRGRYLRERAEEAASTYAAVESGQRVFSLATYLTVRAESREELEDAVRQVQAILRDRPARLAPKTAVCEQDRGLRSVAPIGTDQLHHDVVALGGAVGALLASPHNPSVLEPGGIEVGTHTKTQTPLVVDPFAREDGYAMFTIGDPGSGKSFSAKQQFIRSLEQDPDRIGVILEPLNNWRGVAKALGATRITVGGTRGLNPLEIKPTPPHVLNRRGDDASPLNERRNQAIGFFVNFFALRGVTLGDRRTTLERAFDEAYARQGITTDVRTHDNESPTVRDALDILEEMSEDATGWVVRSEREAEKIRTDALWLLNQLRPFAGGGQLENLGRASEFDIRDESVVYLDLVQQGGSLGGHTSLLMELLISLVYEHAKQVEKEVVFVIDEARYCLSETSTLEYLETIFRHHRHHDLSIRLITQTVDEFFQRPEAEAILDQCSIKQFNKLDAMDDHWAKEFNLNSAEMRFVQNATPGSDAKGYSQALIGIDGEWRGVEVRALDRERHIIESETAVPDQETHSGELHGDATTKRRL